MKNTMQWLLVFVIGWGMGCQDAARVSTGSSAGTESVTESSEEGGESSTESSEEGGESGTESSEEGGESGTESSEEGGESGTESPGEGVVLGAEPQGSPPDLEHPGMDLPPIGAATNRKTIGMLEASIPIIAGKNELGEPINWILPGLSNGKSAWDYSVLGLTLGRPDFVSITSENMEPDMLYVKFMADMAQNVCEQIIDADNAVGETGERVLTRYILMTDLNNAQAIQKNLAYLKLRFHGVKVDLEDTEALDPLNALYLASSQGPGSPIQAAVEGWRAVCIGLFLSPEFHIY